MKFGPVAISDAAGSILAHSYRGISLRLKKGHRLTDDDCNAIRADGINELIVATLAEDDVHEDAAATLIAEAMQTETLRAQHAFTGRVNLKSGARGLFTADRSVVDAINAIDPSITVATLDNETFVEADTLTVTIKIIPFAVERAKIDAAVAIASKQAGVELHQPRKMRVSLIATRLPGVKTSTLDKTRRITDERLERFDAKINDERRVDHDSDLLTAAVDDLGQSHDLIIIFGASAIADIDDIIPDAIRRAGGVVERFGMPVDPGNLLLIGNVGNTVVIGAPGCARSPAENGFDWVLQRVFCGLPVDDAYIRSLGVGGLLKEIRTRTQPRESKS